MTTAQPTDEERRAIAAKHRALYEATKHVSKVNDIPNESHFAVIVQESMRYDNGYGDPRHGPDYSTLDYLGYIRFTTEEALQEWIIENHSKKTFKVISVKPVTVEMKTTITVRD